MRTGTRVDLHTLPHLAKGAFSYEGVDLVAVHPFLAVLDDVVVVVIVVAVIVDLPFLLVAGVLSLALLVTTLLFCIVNLGTTALSVL